MTTQDVIHDIRMFLHDPDGHRWTDDNLLLYINKAIGDIAVNTSAFVKVSAFQLKEGVSTYALPKDVITLNSVWFRGCKLDIISSTSLDDCQSCWVAAKGKPTSVVMDYRTLSLRLVPIPDITTESDIVINGEFDSEYGVISNINIAGKPVDIDYSDETGLISSLSLFDGITVWYSYRPSISSVTDPIPLLSWIFDLIKYYVCGHLLRADRDSNSRAIGNEELMLYAKALRVFKRKSQNHFSSGMLRDLSTVFNSCKNTCPVEPMSFCPEPEIPDVTPPLPTLHIDFNHWTVLFLDFPIWWEYRNNLGETIDITVTTSWYEIIPLWLGGSGTVAGADDSIVARLISPDGTVQQEIEIYRPEILLDGVDVKVEHTFTVQDGDIVVISPDSHIPVGDPIPNIYSSGFNERGIIVTINNGVQFENFYLSRLGGLSFVNDKYIVYGSATNNATPIRMPELDKPISGLTEIQYITVV